MRGNVAPMIPVGTMRRKKTMMNMMNSIVEEPWSWLNRAKRTR